MPVQQVLAPLPVQVAPTPPQVALVVQIPPWQKSPEQQSALAAQVWPVLRQVQVPPTQVICPQQSSEVVHEPLSSEQQRRVVGVGRHEAEVQHSVAIVQAAPDATQAEPPVQTPATQVWPAAQARPQAPQLSSSVWMSAWPVHGPSTHAPPALHVRTRVPHVPQATVMVSPGVHATQGPSAYTQASLQVRVRDWPAVHPIVEVIVVPGEHSPSPVHAPAAIQVHSVLHRAICVPQLPHASTSVVPGVHVPSPVHGSYCH